MDFLAIWQFGPALFACKAPYHLDRVRKNADPLFKRAPIDFIEILKKARNLNFRETHMGRPLVIVLSVQKQEI